MAKKKALPKLVYVKRENEGTQDEYLTTDESVDRLADEDGEVAIVGVYELSKTIKVKRTVEVSG